MTKSRKPKQEVQPVKQEWKVGENTATCESAREDYCSCRCRGSLHGKPHPENWKDSCKPFTPAEKKANKNKALQAWRAAHKEYVRAYMKTWRVKKSQATAKAEAEVEVQDEAEAKAEQEFASLLTSS